MKQTRQMSETIKLGILLAHVAVWCKFVSGES